MLNPKPDAHEPYAWSAVEMRAALVAGRVSATEVLHSVLNWIDAVEPTVEAWTFLDRDGALARAGVPERLADPANSSVNLAGVPFAAKDNIDTSDMPTEYGTVIHHGNAPGRDAACIAAMRLSGGNLLGKTVSTELAHRAPGKTRNPHDPLRTPGGSSSGSAAAVAAHMVPVAFGTQTTGSVIRPAAYCGVLGYKPTYGEFNLSGVLANTPSFDTLGVLARTVQDLVLVRQVLLDGSVMPIEPPRTRDLRVGFCPTPYWSEADEETQALLVGAAQTLREAGAAVTDFAGAELFASLADNNRAVSGYEFARTIGFERLVAQEQLSDELRQGRLADGLRIGYRDYVDGQRGLERSRLMLDAAFDELDFLITPSAAGPAPLGEHTGGATFNMPWTTLHTPAMTLPVFTSSQGMPIGLQLVGRRHDDDRLLAIARAVLELFAEN